MKTKLAIEYVLLCDDIYFKGPKPAFIGVFDRVNVPSFPANLSTPFFIAFKLKGEKDTKYDLQTEIKTPSGDSIAKIGMNVMMGSDFYEILNISLPPGLTLLEAGQYTITIKKAKAKSNLGEAFFEVREIPEKKKVKEDGQ